MSIITLTKQQQNIVGSDVPPQGGAGAPVITPQMFEAGLAAIREHEYDFWETRTPEEKRSLVAAIYGAMLAVSENRRTDSI